jgi:hypothetical protein
VKVLHPDSHRHGDPIYLYHIPESFRSPGMKKN